MAAELGLYAYGITGSKPEYPNIVGIDLKNQVYPVTVGDLSVMVSAIHISQFQEQVRDLFSEFTPSIDTTQSGIEEILRAHETVVDTLMQFTPILPFTFGTVLKDEAAARLLLQEHQAQFQQSLAKCAGKAEWGLKVYVDGQVFSQYSLQANPGYKNLEERKATVSRGTAYLLGKKIEEELKQTVAACLASISETIFQAMEKEAYEAKLNKTLPQKLTGKQHEMILNAVFLVEQAKTTQFCLKGKSLGEQYSPMGLTVEVSGPWPPYNFIKESEGSDEYDE